MVKVDRAGTRARGRRVESRKAPAAPRFDLLEEPFLGVETKDGARSGASLPEVLTLLGRDDVRAFTGMQAHQQHGWHAFLVQLAAIALHRSGESDPRQRAERWRELLLALTKRREPWCLVVEDLAEPAFMQPPVPEGTLEGFKDAQRFPDEIDVLVTSKNHDVKAARIAAPRPEHWAYALVTLQTMEGVMGAKTYGIVRMNSGAGSRPVIGFAPALNLGSRFTRDVQVCLATRGEIAKRYGYRPRNGKTLLWLDEWRGSDSLSVEELDPVFIEICRRVRLVEVNAVISARRCPTDCQRIAGKSLKGNTGDIWTPVSSKRGSAFTASKNGFSYDVFHELLLGQEYAPGAALSFRDGEREMVAIGNVLARGQGETNGLHERHLPVPPKAANIIRRPESRIELARLAKERVDLVSTVQNRVLRPALKVLLQGGPEKLKQDDDRPDTWVHAHDSAVDAIFFERLWADIERDAVEAAREWARLVIELARRQLDAAIDGSPVPAARRYRAIAVAERVFEGAAHNHVSIAFPPREVAHAE